MTSAAARGAGLTVSIDNPSHGWVAIRVQTGKELFAQDFSYVYDSFKQLAEALAAALIGQGARVVWLSEPREYDFEFTAAGDQVELQICEYPDHRRGAVAPQVHFYAAGSFDQICRPFWKAVMDLQGRLGPEELMRLWHRPFPAKEFDQLSEALKVRRRGRDDPPEDERDPG